MSAAEALPFPSEDPSPWRDTSAILGPITPELVAACPEVDPACRTSPEAERDAEDFLAERYEAWVEAAWETHVAERGWPPVEPSDWN